ncbi:MAG TPA: sigma-70 family RNA polymerase sigma factor [Terriglobales bacterium]
MSVDRERSLGSEGSSEVHLVSRAQAGDEAAFAALFEKHKRGVYSLSLRMTRVPADAEDLTQDVFLLLFRKISMFRGDSAFSTWLYRLVMNAALARLRKQGARNVSLGTQGQPQEEKFRPEIGAPDPRLRYCIDRLNLERAISSLPPSYRAVFTLYVVHGYEHSEIAQIMNCSVGNSKAQLHKARQKLRAWLHLDWRRPAGSVSRWPGGQNRRPRKLTRLMPVEVMP